MSRYLYGASVQGIQEFIFTTNKLQEIVGASEIVKQVADEFNILSGYKKGDENILMNAAGNIKAIFDTKEKCEKIVLEFGKIIQQKAYGISISQAVIEIADNYDKNDINNEKQKDINKLEKRLKIQKNKPLIPLDMSLNIMELNPATSKPAISNKMDRATQQKIEAYNNIKDKSNTDLQKLSNSKNKIAVIHIDGNGLGALIPKLKDIGLSLTDFSIKLDEATNKAFDLAKGDKKIRKIILGGDDVTVICDADDALSFTNDFLKEFENETEKAFQNPRNKQSNKLTACAGIAYCNQKYPFHYAVDLAEELCGEAKKQSKEIDKNKAPSSLMFHNIQSASFQEWEQFVKDELTIINDKEIIRCDFGAYYLNQEDKSSISGLINSIESYRCEESPINKLRNWLSELYQSSIDAKNLLERINSIVEQNKKWDSSIMDKNLKTLDKNLSSQNLIIEKDGYRKTPIYDILQVLSITTAYKGKI